MTGSRRKIHNYFGKLFEPVLLHLMLMKAFDCKTSVDIFAH